MSERERQRRLHVQNRLEELNAKYGPVDDSMPDWLDHMPEWAEPRPDASKSPQQAAQPTQVEKPTDGPPANKPAQRASQPRKRRRGSTW